MLGILIFIARVKWTNSGVHGFRVYKTMLATRTRKRTRNALSECDVRDGPCSQSPFCARDIDCTQSYNSNPPRCAYREPLSCCSVLASLDIQNNLRIWDTRAQLCIQTVSEQAHGVCGEVYAMLFSTGLQGVLMFTKHHNELLRQKQGETIGKDVTHLAPVRCCALNARFGTVATAGDDGIVKMWSLHTGQKVFEFRTYHGDADKSPINAIAMDETNTKLITAAENCHTAVWQYSTGQRLHRLQEARKGTNQPQVPGCTMCLLIRCQYSLSLLADWPVHGVSLNLTKLQLCKTKPHVRWESHTLYAKNPCFWRFANLVSCHLHQIAFN